MVTSATWTSRQPIGWTVQKAASRSASFRTDQPTHSKHSISRGRPYGSATPYSSKAIPARRCGDDDDDDDDAAAADADDADARDASRSSPHCHVFHGGTSRSSGAQLSGTWSHCAALTSVAHANRRHHA